MEFQSVKKKNIFKLFAIIFLSINLSFSQKGNIDSLFVSIYEKRLGRSEIEILKRNDKVYIPIISLFNIYNLKLDYNTDKTIFSGYFITNDSTFEINIENLTARYKERIIELFHDEIIIKGNELFLEETVYRELFHWDIKYDDRKVEIRFRSNANFPELQRRQRLRSYQRRAEVSEIEPELNLDRSPKIINLGRFIYKLHTLKNQYRSYNHRYDFKLGGQLLWGDFESSVRGVLTKPVKQRDIRASMKYPFFNNRNIAQLIFGDIQRRSYIGGSLFGVEATNSPADRRTRFSTYQFKDYLFSNEEYYFNIKGQPLLYVQSQQDTSIEQTIPLFYGYNDIISKKYNRYGEEIVSSKFIIVPPQLLPAGILDYKIAVGRLRMKNYPWYGSGDLQYGATDRITLGAGIEYSNRAQLKGRFFPYTYSTLRIYNNIYGTAEFSPFLVSGANITWQTRDARGINMQFHIYEKNPVFNPRNIKHSFNLSTQFPISTKYAYLLLGGNFTQNLYSTTQERSINLNIGANFRRINFIYSASRIHSSDFGTLFFDSRAGTTIQATRFSTISVIGQYDHRNNKIKSTGMGINLSITNYLLLNALVERNYLIKDFFVFVSLNFRPLFFNSQTSFINSNAGATYSQRLNGEILASTESWDILFQNKTTSRRGYFFIHSYFDQNGNGILDGDEKYLKDVGVSGKSFISFGSTSLRQYDSETYYASGENYRDYIFEAKTKDLEDPFWTPKYHGIRIKAEPNKLKTINIPIVRGGIISGSVILEDGEPAAGVKVQLLKRNNIYKITSTNSRGEFEFPTVPPGSYVVNFDNPELNRMGYYAAPDLEFVEITSEQGKEITSVEFVLKQIK